MIHNHLIRPPARPPARSLLLLVLLRLLLLEIQKIRKTADAEQAGRQAAAMTSTSVLAGPSPPPRRRRPFCASSSFFVCQLPEKKQQHRQHQRCSVTFSVLLLLVILLLTVAAAGVDVGVDNNTPSSRVDMGWEGALQHAQKLLGVIIANRNRNRDRGDGSNPTWFTTTVDSRELALVDFWLSRGLMLGPMQAKAHTWAIELLLRLQDPQSQLDHATWIIREVQASGDVVTAGNFALNMGNLSPLSSEIRMPLFEMAVELNPSDLCLSTLGHHYLTKGMPEKAEAMYRRALQLFPERAWLHLALAMAGPDSPPTEEEASRHVKMLAQRMQEAARTIRTLGLTCSDPHLDLGLTMHPNMPWQYLGYGVRPLLEGLTGGVYAMTPDLALPAAGLDPVKGWLPEETVQEEDAADAADKRIRVGVLLERVNIHSPALVMEPILSHLDRSRFEVVMLAEDANYPEDGNRMLAAADSVVWMPNRDGYKSILDEFAPHRESGTERRKVNDSGMLDLWGSARTIAAARVDVLIYVATGNVLVTQMLCLSRLAPVQIVFGLGHPITCGSESVDYFVGSELFETAASIDGREMRRIRREQRGEQEWDGSGEDEDDEVLVIGDGNQDYTEQLVLFESLSGAFRSLPADLIPSQADIDEALREEGLTQDDHIYNCMQYTRKLRPDFDVVLRGILERDPQAKIILLTDARSHLPRWNKTLGPDLASRLIFLYKRPTKEVYAIYAGSDVFLAPFGWSAGITGFEAVGLCVPILTLPSKNHVFQFTAAIIKQLGVEELLASSVEEYISLALRIAADGEYRETLKKRMCMGHPHVFDQQAAAAEEWGAFLARAVQQQRQW